MLYEVVPRVPIRIYFRRAFRLNTGMKQLKQWLSRHWLAVLAIAMLVGTLASFPYAYYQFMDWVVAGASLMIAFDARAHKKETLMWIYVVVAVVYNPVAPLYLRSDLWQATNVVAGLLLVASLFLVSEPNKKSER